MNDGTFPTTFLVGAAGRLPRDGKESREKKDVMNSGNCMRTETQSYSTLNLRRISKLQKDK